MSRPSVDALARGIRAGDRTMLARAITLVESEKPEHVAEAQALLEAVLSDTGGATRLGISGVPGAGKSTFIDAFGTMLTGEGKKVAVLAIDPSSSVSGGSILGDKTRMARLSRDPSAFIRPSPSSGTLGGVHRKTRETMLLCEAFGFDVVLVETVGVGQSETAVADMVDVYLVLMLAGAGDELQGIKRGILEVADVLAINKADGENERRALLAQRELATALRLMRGDRRDGQPPVLTCSALEGRGLPELWSAITSMRESMRESGALDEKRRSQAVKWMWSMIEEGLIASLHRDEAVKRELDRLQLKVAEGEVNATFAAQAILDAHFRRAP